MTNNHSMQKINQSKNKQMGNNIKTINTIDEYYFDG